jgi:hypothetical protein
MGERDMPGEVLDVSRDAQFSEVPIMQIRQDTLDELCYGEDWIKTGYMWGNIPGQMLLVNSPDDPSTREIVLVTEHVNVLGQIFYLPYLGVVEKPQFLRIKQEREEYMQKVRDIVKPENLVDPLNLDKRMRELGGLPERGITSFQ